MVVAGHLPATVLIHLRVVLGGGAASVFLHYGTSPPFS